jgi:hypothetical protein
MPHWGSPSADRLTASAAGATPAGAAAARAAPARAGTSRATAAGAKSARALVPGAAGIEITVPGPRSAVAVIGEFIGSARAIREGRLGMYVGRRT